MDNREKQDAAGKARLVLVAVNAEPGARARPLGAACALACARDEAPDALESSTIAEAVVDESGLAPGLADQCARALGEREAKALVGLSCYAWNGRAMEALVTALRPRFPRAVFVAGGPLATADPGWALGALAADCVVVGEAEGAIAGLARAVAGGARPSGVVRTEPRVFGSAASPWLSRALEVGDGVAWELSRGCPYRCGYCFESRGERGVRALPPSRASEELALFAREGARRVVVLDPTFNAGGARALSLLRAARESLPRARWEFELRAELVDAPLARALGGLDCMVQIGLQSVREDVVAAAGRAGFDRKAFARGARLLDGRGVPYGIDLIYGLPRDSLKGFRESLDFALSLSPNHLDAFRLSVLPGTEFREREGELGLERDSDAPWFVRSLPGFPASDLDRAEGLARAASWCYSRGRAVAWWKSVLAPARISSSAFLELADRVAGGADPASAGDRERDDPASRRAIEAAQREAATSLYRSRGLERLLPLALDWMAFEAAWSAAAADGETRELELSVDPRLLASGAARELEAFAKAADRGRFRVRVEADDGGPRLVLPRR